MENKEYIVMVLDTSVEGLRTVYKKTCTETDIKKHIAASVRYEKTGSEEAFIDGTTSIKKVKKNAAGLLCGKAKFKDFTVEIIAVATSDLANTPY